MQETLEIWHEFVESGDAKVLHRILHEDVKFHSPVVWKPKEGRELVTHILLTAGSVFKDFRYVREVIGEHDAVLEFSAKIGELEARGVDIIKVDDDGMIVDFEVMVRPGNALQALGMQMGAKLGI